MKYRPENWENPYEYKEPVFTSDVIQTEKNVRHLIFEAGADAMLEALRKPNEQPYFWKLKLNGVRGIHVFIPDGDSINKEVQLENNG